MENHNSTPSKDSSSPNNNSPPSNEPPPSNSTNNNSEGFIMKTPWQVLEELGGSSGDEDGGRVGGENGVATAANTAVVSGGGDATVVEGVVAAPVREEMAPTKKRKASVVRDPPSGKPICPICNKEFASWKAAFGHMRAHPNRDYRGFFKPPVFGSSSSIQDEPPSEGDSGAKKSVDEDNNGEKVSASSPVKKLLPFDLNEALPEEEGESSDAAKPAEENNVVEGRNDSRFDLNEVPCAEDSDDA